MSTTALLPLRKWSVCRRLFVVPGSVPAAMVTWRLPRAPGDADTWTLGRREHGPGVGVGVASGVTVDVGVSVGVRVGVAVEVGVEVGSGKAVQVIWPRISPLG